MLYFFFSSRRRHTRSLCDWSSDVCSSDLMELLAWGNTAMEPHLFRIKPGGGSGESYSHEGEEFLHVLRGNFEIWLDAKEHYHLKPGDSLYFESSTPHRWKNPGRTETWLLSINTPPTF